jgi:hypothetical protein
MELYLIFGALLSIGVVAALYWSVRSYRIYQTNLLVSEELDKIIAETLKAVQKNKRSNRPDLEGAGLSGGPDLINSPDLMSTIITVLINKFGDVRLGMQDFMISDEEYVSVYVDTQTEEIILSTNSDLSVADLYTGFRKPGDGTFH